MCLTSMSQTQGPQSQVGGSVGDAAQTVLDGVDHLMHEDLPCIELEQKKNNNNILFTDSLLLMDSFVQMVDFEFAAAQFVLGSEMLHFH